MQHNTETKKIQARSSRYLRNYLDIADSPNVLALRQKNGWNGVGIWQEICRRLAAEPGYRLKCDYPLIAYTLRIDSEIELVRSIVEDYGLFEVFDGYFFAPEVRAEMESLDEMLLVRRAAGKKGGRESVKKRANGQANGQARKGMERSGNKTTEVETSGGGISPPDWDEIINLWNEEAKDTPGAMSRKFTPGRTFAETWAQYSDLAVWRTVFRTALSDDFAWRLRNVIKLENFEQLLQKEFKQRTQPKRGPNQHAFKELPPRDSYTDDFFGRGAKK